jgi:DNA helicase-2/ATP-dependent DNA helicase PcrA
MNKILDENFKKEYNKLNLEQKEAVDSIEGPVMVIAGPGTGKTHLLSMRIANILNKTDTPPEGILALTFTESGVASMRKNLIRIIGSDAYSVNITTFHSFANDIIKSYPDEFPDIIGSKNITDVEQINIIKDIIDNLNLETLKPFGDNYFYVRSIISSINELKRQGLLPKQFEKLVKEEEETFLKIEDLYYEKGVYKGRMKGKYIKEKKYIDRNKELSKIYTKYHDKLRELHFYDYGDMIMQVMIVLEKNKELLLILQEQYLYILVDEHQDTNSAQNRILELLANYYETPNLFIVGDEKQAIFRFQGASRENFLYFKNLYKKVKVVNLKSNYRSTQTILNVADNVISSEVNLLAKAGHKENLIDIFSFSSLEAEQYFLAKNILKNIKELKKEKRSLGEIAVLYRENKNVIPIARMFEKLGVPFIIESDQNIMDDKDIKKLLMILKTVQNFGSGKELIEMLHIDIFNIPPIDVYKISNVSNKRFNPYDVIKSSEIMKKEGIGSIDKLKSIYENLSIWKKSSLYEDAVKSFENIVRDSGFLSSLISNSSAIDKIKKLHTLFGQIKTLVENNKNYTLNDFFSYLDVLKEHNVFIKSESVFAPDKVRLMTAHKSKGLEFDYVYIFNVIDRCWGFRKNMNLIKLPETIFFLSNKNKSFASDDNNDERNLFYVALTRARKKIVITYSNYNQNGREQLPSKFLQDIKRDYIKFYDTNNEEKEFNNQKEIEFAPVINKQSTVKEKKLLNELFYKYGLSATALNNYLECPWKYFYRNLIRIPESPNKHLMFGTAVHNALNLYFNRLVKGEDLKEKYLINKFIESLNNLPIQEKEYQEVLDKGIKALTGYYKNYHQIWKNNVLSEFNIRGIELDKGLVINGKIDKIEIIGLSNNVNVIDYKTGKPKSRNEIDGKTKNNSGNYKRQLVFYNLLLNNYQSGKFKMVSGEIDFIEPDKNGNYKKEKFEISKKEVKELEEQIKTIGKEIINLDFWNKSCSDPKCEYCNMRKIMN